MVGIKKLLAGAGAAALVAGVAVLGVSAPAHAAGQSIKVTPNAGLKGGDTVTVTYSGYTPNAPVAVGICADRPVKGPGDCGRTKDNAAKLTTADASGGGTVELTVIEGALGNLTAPAAKCPVCTMGATNITDANETASVKLNYASDSGAKAAVVKKTVAKKAAVKKTGLASTGPRETLITALIALALLQLGVVFTVRAHRASPRRTIA